MKMLIVFQRLFWSLTRQPHKIVKHTQTICWEIADELSEFDHFVGLGLNDTHREKLVLCWIQYKN